MAATNNDPLWFARYDEYPHEEDIAKPEGREPNGFRIEVPLAIVENLYPAEGRPDRETDEFYQEYSWYRVPLEVHTPEGWKTNPAALARPNRPNELGRMMVQDELYRDGPVSHLTFQKVPGQPFVQFMSSKRGVAGVYYCVRKREKNPEGYRVTDSRNYMPVARIRLVINNVQEERYALDGQRLILSAPVILPLLHGGQVRYRWALYRYPTIDAINAVLNGVNNAVKHIRELIRVGDANPHQAYLNLPTQRREVSLILAGYDMNAEGKFLVQTPLPELEEYKDLSAITIRLTRGYIGYLAREASNEDIILFVEQLQHDVIRAFTDDQIIRKLVTDTPIRMLKIASVSAGGHQGMFRCDTVIELSDEYPIRRMVPELPYGYGMSWIPSATFRVHVLDQLARNYRQLELTAFTYSPARTRAPAVHIIDVNNQEDVKRNLNIQLRDAPSQFWRNASASVAWHIELIPDVVTSPYVPVLPSPDLRTPLNTATFLRDLVGALNRLAAETNTPRYLFGHSALYQVDEKDKVTRNTDETYRLRLTPETFAEDYTAFVSTLNEVLKRRPDPSVGTEALKQLQKHTGYTMVIAAFLENPRALGGSVQSSEQDDDGEVGFVYYGALLHRLIAQSLASVGLDQSALRLFESFANTSDQLAQAAARDFANAETKHSSNDKPLLGMFVVQYNLDQDDLNKRIRAAEALREKQRIQMELREQGNRSWELIEANIATYEPLIKSLLANRRLAAEYVDWLITKGVSNLPSIENRDPFALEYALRLLLQDAQNDPSRLLKDYGVRPVSYGSASNPRNKDGFDAVWYRPGPGLDREPVFIAPLARGEGIAMFTPVATESTTFTDAAIGWLINCFRQYTKLLVKPPNPPGRAGPVGALRRRPDERTPNEVVEFLSDEENNRAFVSIVSVVQAATTTALQKRAYEDLMIVISTLTDLNAIRQAVDPSSEPLSVYLRAIRDIPVEDDDFSSKRYRRLLASTMFAKLARLASVMNIVQFRASGAIGYDPSRQSSSPSTDSQISLSREERSEQLARKQLLDFDPQRYVTQASIHTLSLALKRILETPAYESKLSDADRGFLRDFFRVPEPPKDLTELDETPVIIRLPKQGDIKQTDVERGPTRTYTGPLFTERREPRPVINEDESTVGPDEQTEEDSGVTQPPLVTKPSRKPRLDVSVPQKPPSGPAENTKDMEELIQLIANLSLNDNERVGAARYLRPVAEAEAARHHAPPPPPPQPSPPRVVYDDSELDSLIWSRMRAAREKLRKPVDRKRAILFLNRKVLQDLNALVYASTEDRDTVEGLFGYLIQLYDRTLMELKEVIRDAFELSSIWDPGVSETNRVHNEIRKTVLRELLKNPVTQSGPENLDSLVTTATNKVYDAIAAQLDQVETRFKLPPPSEVNLMRSFHFFFDEESALKTWIKSLVLLKQYWDEEKFTTDLTNDDDKRGAAAKIKFYTDVIVPINGLGNVDAEAERLRTLLRTAPSSISASTSTELRAAAERLKSDAPAYVQAINDFRSRLEEVFVAIRQRVFTRLATFVSPESEGLSIPDLIQRIRKEIYREFFSGARTDLEAVVQGYSRVKKWIAAVRQGNADWEARLAVESSRATQQLMPPPPARPVKPAAAPGPTREELDRLRADLAAFLRSHNELVASQSGLQTRSSDAAKQALKRLTDNIERQLTSPPPGADLTSALSRFYESYIDAFWTDKPVVTFLAEKVLASPAVNQAFTILANYANQSKLPGQEYLVVVVSMLESGREQTIRLLTETFDRSVRRALAVPRWTIQPAVDTLAPDLAEEDRLARAKRLTDLTGRVFQDLLGILRELAVVRVRAAEYYIRTNVVTSTTGSGPDQRTRAIPSLDDLRNRLRALSTQYSEYNGLANVWTETTALWKRLLDLLRDATVSSHSHLMPWLKDVPNVKLSTQQNARFAGQCALETFCYISDGSFLTRIFALAGQLVALEKERLNSVLLPGGLEAAIAESEKTTAEEEAKPFLSLLTEIASDLEAGRLPLSTLVARSQPVSFDRNPALEKFLTKNELRVSTKPSTTDAWGNELSVLCIATRKIVVDTLMAARTEVSAQHLIPAYTAQLKGQESDVIRSKIISTLAVIERSLTAPNLLSRYVDFFTAERAEVNAEKDLALDQDLLREASTISGGSTFENAFRAYFKSVRAYVHRTGLRRLGDAIANTFVHLADAESPVKTDLARNLFQAFAPQALQLYTGFVQEPTGIDGTQREAQVSDLSEAFVRRVLEVMNILPRSQNTSLLTGEDLQRYFSYNTSRLGKAEFAEFVNDYVLCGSNRVLMTETYLSTWSVAIRSTSNAALWQRVAQSALVSPNAPIRPNATEATSVPNRSTHEISLDNLLTVLKGLSSDNSRMSIRRPYPAIMLNGSLVMDILRKIDEIAATSNSENRGALLVRQLGVIAQFNPIREARPDDTLRPVAPPSPEEIVELEGVVGVVPSRAKAAAAAVPTMFALPKSTSPSSQPSSAGGSQQAIAADVSILLDRVREGRAEVQRALDTWADLYQRFSTQLTASVRVTVENAGDDNLKKTQINASVTSIVDKFNRKSEAVRKALLDRMDATKQYEELAVQIQSGRIDAALASPTMSLVKTVEIRELRDIRDSLNASEVRFKELDTASPSIIIAAARVINTKFATSRALQEAKQRVRAIDRAVLAGVQNSGT